MNNTYTENVKAAANRRPGRRASVGCPRLPAKACHRGAERPCSFPCRGFSALCPESIRHLELYHHESPKLISPLSKDSPNRGLLTKRQIESNLKISGRTHFGLTHPRASLMAIRIGRIVRFHADDLKRFLELTRPDASVEFTQNQTEGQNNEVN